MNIHHLELFYYVAKFGGISEGVRNIPYGIQQPAMSSQIIQLEEFLGISLFQRRPFSLTPAGQELFNFIRPFFDNLDATADRLRGGEAQHLRIGASEIVLRDYLPSILQRLRGKFPNLKVTLREGYQPQSEGWLSRHELDVAITILDGKPAAGMRTLSLFKLPLILLVTRQSKLRSAAELWKEDKIAETLISFPTNEPIYKNFQQGLARLGVDWFTGIEVSTVDLVETYVANGYGIGLSVAIPGAKLRPGIRALPLEGFQPVNFGVLWQGKATPLIDAFLAIVEEMGRKLNAAAQESVAAVEPAEGSAPAEKPKATSPGAKEARP